VELNWSTFTLEIINFLVLLWILKHFFYKPVLNVISTRQANIVEKIDSTLEKEKAAKTLIEQYNNRLHVWQKEKQEAQQALQDEIAHKRSELLKKMHDSMEAERQKLAAQEQERLQNFSRNIEAKAFEHAAIFASKLLSRLASAELEARIAHLVLEDLASLPLEQMQALRESFDQSQKSVEIQSAYALSEALRDKFKHSLSSLLKSEIAIETKQEPGLISGLRITIGTWRFEASLAEELKMFRQLSEAVT